jgi:hypothetical protein
MNFSRDLETTAENLGDPFSTGRVVFAGGTLLTSAGVTSGKILPSASPAAHLIPIASIPLLAWSTAPVS